MEPTLNVVWPDIIRLTQDMFAVFPSGKQMRPREGFRIHLEAALIQKLWVDIAFPMSVD